jgi:hypothetical protein
MTVPNLRPLAFGEILDSAFTLYRRNFLLFLGTTLLLMMGVLLAAMFLGGLGAFAMAVMPGLVGFIALALVVVAIVAVAMIPWGALTQQASQSYTGGRTSLAEGVGAGGRSAMTLVGAAIIAFLTFSALMVGIFIVAALLNGLVAMAGFPSLSLVVSALSVLALMASLFFVAALFFGVLPAVVIEEKGPVEAIARSLKLAQGAIPRIAGLMAVTLLITYLPILAVMMVTGGFERFADPSAANLGQQTGSILMQQLLTWLVTVLTTPFMLAVIVVLYYDRRVRTEALDVQILTDRLGLAPA